jgi:hypothetical protein
MEDDTRKKTCKINKIRWMKRVRRWRTKVFKQNSKRTRRRDSRRWGKIIKNQKREKKRANLGDQEKDKMGLGERWGQN